VHRTIRRLALLALGGLLLPAVAVAAPGPTVAVRVEGESQTLLPRTVVTTSTDPVPESGCSGTSVAGAIEVATKGNWDHAQGGFTSTILGETHNFSNNNDYWFEWLNGKGGNGVCNDQVQNGDEILMLVDHSTGNPDFAPTVFPMTVVESPAKVNRGTAFTVRVSEIHTANGFPGTGDPRPAAGATVSGGGTSATTDSEGRATLALPNNGTFSLRAHRGPGDGNASRSIPVAVCVHDGDDGTCGTLPPRPVPLTGARPLERILPSGYVFGIRMERIFRQGRAPRLLRGTAYPDESGIRDVRLRLWRHYRGRCWFWSAAREELVQSRCGRRDSFSVGRGLAWSYLLPEQLPPGHYHLDMIAVDGSGNGSIPVPGRNRKTFRVR
jgi:hypothetical protein